MTRYPRFRCEHPTHPGGQQHDPAERKSPSEVLSDLSHQEPTMAPRSPPKRRNRRACACRAAPGCRRSRPAAARTARPRSRPPRTPQPGKRAPTRTRPARWSTRRRRGARLIPRLRLRSGPTDNRATPRRFPSQHPQHQTRHPRPAATCPRRRAARLPNPAQPVAKFDTSAARYARCRRPKRGTHRHRLGMFCWCRASTGASCRTPRSR